ncbi:hypothetical protein GWC77_02550 [Paraburkholderia sp. NMBU_R16]|uniref:hypothetical protein n=1 Tax=Paraburkholderia sp. NMBU_R16 TaxID=2698676 RepID=UPI00156681D4|nr:hypothetical protein [Paraburkholderia sp. NMBU_R16]NRO94826.1 hypothetical protein [Paraburkholderia sp. NMBU_R16]
MSVQGPNGWAGGQTPPGGYPDDQPGVHGTPQGNSPPPPGYPPPPPGSPPPGAWPNGGQFSNAPQWGPGSARGAQFRESGARLAEVGAQVAGRVGDWLGKTAKKLLPPEKAVANGAKVSWVLENYGLHPSYRPELERLAAEGAQARERAVKAVLAPHPPGDMIAQVARDRFGINDQRNVTRLRWNVAQDLVRQHRITPDDAMTRCGLPESAREDLMEIALEGPARHAVQQGYAITPAMIREIANAHGIGGNPMDVMRLTAYAAAHRWNQEAQSAAMYRMPPPPFEPIASQYGIHPDVLRTVLAAVAIEQGEPIDSIMYRLGLPPNTRMQLEAHAMEKGPASLSAAQQQIPPWQLARQYGISDPLGSGLERAALRGPIGAAVRADLQAHVDIGEISRRYGITPAAIQAAHGTPLNEIFLNPSLSTEQRQRANAQLAHILLDGRAGEALRAGADISVVVKNYGIDQPTVEAYSKRMQYRQP